MRDEVIAELHPRGSRRWIGIGIQGLLGGLLLQLGFSIIPSNAVTGLPLVALGLLALWGVWGMYRATEVHLELTHDVLRESTGRVLARVDEVTGVERGVLAFKPTNGFLVRLKTAAPATWAPGLWWRMGRSVGVGGVTAAQEGRAMAEILSALIGETD